MVVVVAEVSAERRTLVGIPPLVGGKRTEYALTSNGTEIANQSVRIDELPIVVASFIMKVQSTNFLEFSFVRCEE